MPRFPPEECRFAVVSQASAVALPYNLLRSMRPRQWIKNLLLFAGIVFSHNLDDPVLILRALAGFGLFCALSGAVYILNDLADLESDRLHPSKSRRPLAAGLVGPRTAGAYALVCAAGALGTAFLLSQPFFLSAVAYFVIALLYSHAFKHFVVLDIILLGLGFVLRAIAGVFVIRTDFGDPVPMTPWFVICVLFLSLFIATCKRRQELAVLEAASGHRPVLDDYTPAILDQMIAVSTSATVISYALYLVARSQEAGQDPESLRMISTLPFVLYGIFRYLYLVYKKNEGGEPERLILKDKPLLINTVFWLAIMVYLHKG